MKITDCLLPIKAALDDFVAPNGGEVQIAIDHTQMWQIAAVSQDSLRIILCFDHQEARGDESVQDVLGKVYNHYAALVTRGRGYSQDPGVSFVGSDGENDGGSAPFYDLVEQARDVIRGVTYTDPQTEDPIWFRGIEKAPYDPSVPIYGYIINFSVGTVIGDLVTENANT